MEAVNSMIVDQTEEDVKCDENTVAGVDSDKNCGEVTAQWSPEQSNMVDEASVAKDFPETITRPTIFCRLNHLRGDPSTTLTAAQLDVLDGVARDLLVAAVRRSLLLPPVSLDQRPNDDGRVLSPPQQVSLAEIEMMVDIGDGKDNEDDDTKDNDDDDKKGDDHDDSKEDDDHDHDDSKEDDDHDHDDTKKDDDHDHDGSKEDDDHDHDDSKEDDDHDHDDTKEDDDHDHDDSKEDDDHDNVNSNGNGDGTGLDKDPTTVVESTKAAVKPRGKSSKSFWSDLGRRVTRVARRLICCVPSRR